MKLERVLIIWILLLSIVYSALSIIRHNHFQSGGFDLGIYDQAMWQYSRFQWPYNTIKDRFILGDHLTLTLPLLAPLFWLWSDARMLLIFQAVWISFSALAIYKVAKLRGHSEVTALCLTFVYSLFYGIQYLVYFDFHPVVIGVGLLAWIAYFLESGKTRWLTQIPETNEHWMEAIGNIEKVDNIKLIKSVGAARLYKTNTQDIIKTLDSRVRGNDNLVS